jgi:hypothetical protein
MIGLYFKIAGMMFFVFSIILFVIPLGMYLKSLIDDTLNDTSDSWRNNRYLVYIDMLYDSVSAYDIEDRFWATAITVLLCTVLWVFGIVAVLYIIGVMTKKIKNDQYDDIVNKRKGSK